MVIIADITIRICLRPSFRKSPVHPPFTGPPKAVPLGEPSAAGAKDEDWMNAGGRAQCTCPFVENGRQTVPVLLWLFQRDAWILAIGSGGVRPADGRARSRRFARLKRPSSSHPTGLPEARRGWPPKIVQRQLKNARSDTSNGPPTQGIAGGNEGSTERRRGMGEIEDE